MFHSIPATLRSTPVLPSAVSSRRLGSVLLLVLALLTGFAGAATAQDDTPKEEDPPKAEILTPPGAKEEVPIPTTPLDEEGNRRVWDPEHVDDFTLVDQNGRTIKRKDLLGRPWVASFIFTRCVEQCPAMCARIRGLIKDLDREKGKYPYNTRFVSITVDVEHDTPELMKNFADIYAPNPDDWLFLTGTEQEVVQLIREGFKVPFWKNKIGLPGMQFAHDMHLIHVDENGKIVGWYDGQTDRDIGTLKLVLQGRKETPENKKPARPGQALPGATSAAVELTTSPPTGAGAGAIPAWVNRLPGTNAALNGLATLLLLAGFIAIKGKRIEFHKRMMVFAFCVSIAFLGSYLTYHFGLKYYTGASSKRFAGTGTVLTVYRTILFSHIILAAVVPVLASITLYRGYRQQWEAHRRIAKITFPIWLYVAVTGVIIYWMLYHGPWDAPSLG